MKKLLFSVALALLALSSAKAQIQTYPLPFISTYSTFGRNTSSGYIADSYNAYDSISGATNINSGLPSATATGSAIFTNDLYGGTQVTSSASAIGGGFYVAKNYASIAVESVQDSGYIAAGVYGSHTQLKFLVAPENAVYSVFKWNVTGSTRTSPDTGYAGAVLRFLAGYYPDQTYNSIFNTPTPPANVSVFENTGSFSYNLPIVLGQDLDLFYQATASVQLTRDEAQGILGTPYSAIADFASTTTLESIELYDANNQRITTDWTLADVSTGEALFNQNGRVGSGNALPEPTTIAFVLIGSTLVLMRRRK